MKKIGIFVSILLPFVSVVLLVVQIILTNELAKDAGHMQAIDLKISALTDDTVDLSHRIASASSLMTLKEKASLLGFSPGQKFVSFPKDYMMVAYNNPQ